jgi:hypothetical protein
MQGKLRARINRIKNFRDAKEQRNCIEETLEDDQLVLIVSGQLDRQLMSSLHQLRQVSRIYIDSVDKESDGTWACQFTKVSFFDKYQLCCIVILDERHQR